jgi:hypothetical protein
VSRSVSTTPAPSGLCSLATVGSALRWTAALEAPLGTTNLQGLLSTAAVCRLMHSLCHAAGVASDQCLLLSLAAPGSNAPVAFNRSSAVNLPLASAHPLGCAAYVADIYASRLLLGVPSTDVAASTIAPLVRLEQVSVPPHPRALQASSSPAATTASWTSSLPMLLSHARSNLSAAACGSGGGARVLQAGASPRVTLTLLFELPQLSALVCGSNGGRSRRLQDTTSSGALTSLSAMNAKLFSINATLAFVAGQLHATTASSFSSALDAVAAGSAALGPAQGAFVASALRQVAQELSVDSLLLTAASCAAVFSVGDVSLGDPLAVAATSGADTFGVATPSPHPSTIPIGLIVGVAAGSLVLLACLTGLGITFRQFRELRRKVAAAQAADAAASAATDDGQSGVVGSGTLDPTAEAEAEAVVAATPLSVEQERVVETAVARVMDADCPPAAMSAAAQLVSCFVVLAGAAGDTSDDNAAATAASSAVGSTAAPPGSPSASSALVVSGECLDAAADEFRAVLMQAVEVCETGAELVTSGDDDGGDHRATIRRTTFSGTDRNVGHTQFGHKFLGGKSRSANAVLMRAAIEQLGAVMRPAVFQEVVFKALEATQILAAEAVNDAAVGVTEDVAEEAEGASASDGMSTPSQQPLRRHNAHVSGSVEVAAAGPGGVLRRAGTSARTRPRTHRTTPLPSAMTLPPRLVLQNIVASALASASHVLSDEEMEELRPGSGAAVSAVTDGGSSAHSGPVSIAVLDAHPALRSRLHAAVLTAALEAGRASQAALAGAKQQMLAERMQGYRASRASRGARRGRGRDGKQERGRSREGLGKRAVQRPSLGAIGAKHGVWVPDDSPAPLPVVFTDYLLWQLAPLLRVLCCCCPGRFVPSESFILHAQRAANEDAADGGGLQFASDNAMLRRGAGAAGKSRVAEPRQSAADLAAGRRYVMPLAAPASAGLKRQSGGEAAFRPTALPLPGGDARSSIAGRRSYAGMTSNPLLTPGGHLAGGAATGASVAAASRQPLPDALLRAAAPYGRRVAMVLGTASDIEEDGFAPAASPAAFGATFDGKRRSAAARASRVVPDDGLPLSAPAPRASAVRDHMRGSMRGSMVQLPSTQMTQVSRGPSGRALSAFGGDPRSGTELPAREVLHSWRRDSSAAGSQRVLQPSSSQRVLQPSSSQRVLQPSTSQRVLRPSTQELHRRSVRSSAVIPIPGTGRLDDSASAASAADSRRVSSARRRSTAMRRESAGVRPDRRSYAERPLSARLSLLQWLRPSEAAGAARPSTAGAEPWRWLSPGAGDGRTSGAAGPPQERRVSAAHFGIRGPKPGAGAEHDASEPAPLQTPRQPPQGRRLSIALLYTAKASGYSRMVLPPAAVRRQSMSVRILDPANGSMRLQVPSLPESRPDSSITAAATEAGAEGDVSEDGDRWGAEAP